MGIRDRGTGTYDDALTNAIAVSNKLSFVFDPGTSCPLPESIKPWQANLQVG